MSQDRRSPLHAAQEAAGAEFIWEDGWPWAMHIGRDPMDEYEAIRTGTGLWDLFSTIKYEVTGPDAALLIQRRFTNDLSGLEPGAVRYGAFVNPDGLMIDEGNVYKHADDRFWVMINTADLEDWFRESSNDLDAEIVNRTEDLPMVAACGPTSRELLQGLTDADLSSLRYFHFWPDPIEVAGVQATLLRTSFSGELGFELVTDPASMPRLWEALVQSGGVPFGITAIELARTEAGLVIMAEDYEPGVTSPVDLSMDRFIKPGTQCVGLGALTEALASPAKRFKTLKIEGDAVPEAGALVLRDGEEVGVVTSPASSPRLGTIALAILQADASDEGTALDVAVGDDTAAAEVDVLSLHDPDKRKPRS